MKLGKEIDLKKRISEESKPDTKLRLERNVSF
jgi:hypothetical protein